MKSAQRYDIEGKTTLSAYKYLYNGKELQDELGLEVYDFHSRYYDPVIGRFMSQDPMAESMSSWSPYSFTFNNPIRFNDPTGMIPGDYYKANGTYLGNDGIDDDKVYIADGTETVKDETTGEETTSFTNAEEIGLVGDFLNMNGYSITSSELKKNLVGLSIHLNNEEITREYGQIQVHSGDRGDVKNAIAGGVKGSLHLTGKAADISINGLSNEALAKGAASSGLFGGIVYYPDRGNTRGFGTHSVPQQVSRLSDRAVLTVGAPTTSKNWQTLGPHVHVDQRSGSYLGRYSGFNPTVGSKGKNTYTPWKSKTSIW